MKNYIFLIVGFIMLLASCRAVKPPEPVITDSVFVEKVITYRDTVFVTSPATASLNIPLKDISNGFKAPLTVQNKQARATVTKIGDQLKIDCICDTVAIKASMRETAINKNQTKTIQLPPEQVRYIPWHINFLAVIGSIYLLLTAGFFAIKAFR